MRKRKRTVIKRIRLDFARSSGDFQDETTALPEGAVGRQLHAGEWEQTHTDIHWQLSP